MKLCLDTVGYALKPDKGEIKSISLRIAGNIAETDNMEALAKQLVLPNGRTWVPSVFSNGKRSNGTWVSQQLYGLDFDDGITVEQVLERCKEYGIMPAFIYSTFSSIDNNKFRVVFVNDQEITDYRLRLVLQIGLMTMFKESDKSCKDAARLYFGGKELIYKDYGSMMNPVDMVRGLCRYISETDVNSHASREIKRYCESVGLDMVNGMPKVIPARDKDDSKEDAKSTKIGVIDAAPMLYIYRLCGENAKNETFEFHFSNTNTTHKSRAEGKQKKFSVVNEKIEREYLRRFDFKELDDCCRLWHEFSSGKIALTHDERFGLATNLCCIEGGRERFIAAVELQGTKDINAWQYQCNYINRLDYAPHRCIKFCPYAETCEHAKNILEQTKTARGRIVIISTPEYKTLEQAERELRQHFMNATAVEDTNVYVLRAPTGIGKTELYLDVKNTTVCLPTHELKNEVAKRMIDRGNNFVASPELPSISPEYDEQIQKLYDVGAYGAAHKMIRNLSKDIPQLKEYLDQLKTLKRAKGNILTTHARALYLKDNNDTMIIDEDITQTLLKVDSITLEDLNIVVHECCSIENFSRLKSIQEVATDAHTGLVYKMPSFFLDKKVKLENILVDHRLIRTNVIGFLNCDYFVKDELPDGTIVFYFVNRAELPDKKVIIMSATVNETICKLLFGDRLRFIDIGAVETVGNLKQYPQHSYSRYQMKANGDLMKLASAIAGDSPVITYKKFKDDFANCVMTFGATSGIDAYAGKDICVVGTPHATPVTYLLVANALGQTPRFNDSNTMEYQIIRRNGFSFWFQTYSDKDILREIQLFMIESELTQAIGRARILRKDCTVTLLSNLPMIGAEFMYLSKEQEEQYTLQRGR